MKLLVQMDEISSIKIKTDTTFLLLLAAQESNWEIYYYHPSHLFFDSTKKSSFAKVNKLFLQKDEAEFYKILDTEIADLRTFDVILIRQNPPFDMKYLTATYILEKIKDDVLILNDPTEIRNCPEKIWVSEFSDLTPPTLICSDIDLILEFLLLHDEIVIKPLYGFGGESVLLLKTGDKNIISNISMMLKLYNNLPFISQKFLPNVESEDKRIFLVDGVPISAISLIPKNGEIRANMAVGGSAFKYELNQKDVEICNRLKPFLQKKNLFLAGIDLIGDYLIEINITSPTGIAAMNSIYGQNYHHQIFKKIIGKLL